LVLFPGKFVMENGGGILKIYYYLFYMFIIYSFLGWVLEVFYHLYKERRFVNRGFLHGPLCPIYGTTGVLLICALSSFNKNVMYIFLGGTVLASVMELVTGYLMEVFFHAKWWDYSKERFNIKGYICLKFSVFWGFLSIVFIRFINPPISRLTYLLINHFGDVLYNIILIILIADTALTINSLITFRKLFTEIQDIILERKESLEKLLEKNLSLDARAVLQNRINHLADIRERLVNRISLRHKDMLHAYPKISSKSFNFALEEVKKRIEKIKDFTVNH
jgi:uncharacterized membrane protein